VNRDRIIPLLDGLDELPLDARAACVDAINLFQTDRPESFAELVVTCRSDDYFELSNRLNMTGAVMLRPLASQAIVSLLTSAGAQFEGIRQALERDPALRDLAATPLVLDLLMRTYRGAGVDSLPLSGDKPMRLEQLFAAYAELMLRRRSGHAPYTRGQSVGWLTWLANGLARESQSVLYIERLQPDWLTTRAGRIAYPLLDRLVFGFLLGVLEGVIAALVIDPLWALGFAAVVAVAVCLSGRTTEGDRSAWRAVSAFLLGGLATGGVITLLLFATVRSGDQSQILPTAALLGALVGAPMAALAGGPWIGARRIRLVERVSWSLSRALRSATASLSGVALIAVILVLAALGQSQDMIKIGLLVAIALGAPPALVTAVLGGFVSKDLVDETQRRTPNQGIIRGGRTALIAAGLSALASGASIVVTFGLFGSALGSDIFFLGGPFRGLLESTPAQVQVAVVLGVIFASLYGLIGGLAYGGYAYLSHFALRLTLWREHAIPLHCIRFLNYANDCVLLRRVGGGYKFVHGLLQDYFAGLSRDPQR